MVNDLIGGISLWVEKYRPNTIQECILPVKIKESLQGFADRKELPNLILAGSAGTGKTTSARALCRELNCDVLFINASLENGIDVLRNKITQFASSVSLTGNRKVVILDEGDYTNASSFQPALRGFIERFYDNVRFIITCNYLSKILPPIQSRCTVINFDIPSEEKQTLFKETLSRLFYILKQEDIKFDPKSVCKLLLNYYPDIRRCINELQRYSVSGCIDEDILTNITKDNYTKLVESLKNKNFKDMRSWVANNKDIPPETLFSYFYENGSTFMEPSSLPQMIITTAEYQYKSAFVADQEINLAAYLIELMVNCSFI